MPSQDSRAQNPTLFDDEPDAARRPGADAPLAARMRPTHLDEFVGQEALVGPGSALRQSIEADRLASAIFWGPPGCGKSTLASVIAKQTRAAFENYSAVTSGVADVRKVIDRARERRSALGQRTILFVDEIHRWNKGQQDALLPHVEDGTVVLIGATTENPYFEVNAPLISRARIYRFERLSDEAIGRLVDRALADRERGFGRSEVQLEPNARDHLIAFAGGDARNALNGLEAAVRTAISRDAEAASVSLADAEEAAQQRALAYDKQSDEHYDTISAFIKSIRGSDPDAALYWLAKMLEAGEDVKFVARRLVISASEDIGNAEPMGLVLANSAAQAVMFVGLPEAQLILSQATTYLATCPKSNAATLAISRAREDIRTNGAAPVPLHLRSAAYAAAKKMGHGEGYRYPHDAPDGHVNQEYAPSSARSGPYYEPTDRGAEAEIRARMEKWRAKAASDPEKEE